MDRETAARNIRTGLLFASVAVGALALAFIIAMIYIRG
jgi:hypothetical protein